MARVGRQRYIEFRVSDINGTAVTGLHLSDFQVIFFRNNVSCSDVLSLTDDGSGLYVLTYTPSVVGHDYIDLYNVANDVRASDSEDVDDADSFFGADDSIVNLTQDYGTVNRFKILYPGPDTYSVLVFTSMDWQAGRTSSSSSIIGTTIDASGNWISTPLPVLHGTYHIVATNGSINNVLAAYLQV